MQRSETFQPALHRHDCLFCGYELVSVPVQNSSGLVFCSKRCRDAYGKEETPFAGHHEFKRFSTGVSPLDSLLPNGVPSNTFLIFTGAGGIRHRGMQTELLWRRLCNGEPAIVITYVDPPIAIVEQFLTFGWNVLPFLESGDLRIIDCFTARLRKEHQTPEHQADWNSFLSTFLDDAVSSIREPGDLMSVEDTLHEQLEAKEMTGTGMVVIDSLNEVETQGHESEMEQFIKEVRGDICSRKFVPIVTSVARTENVQLTRDYTYLFDGIVEMQRTDAYADGTRLKQLGIQKMDGVLYRPHWVTYEITGPQGFQLFEPNELLESVYGVPANRLGPSDPTVTSRQS